MRSDKIKIGGIYRVTNSAEGGGCERYRGEMVMVTMYPCSFGTAICRGKDGHTLTAYPSELKRELGYELAAEIDKAQEANA